MYIEKFIQKNNFLRSKLKRRENLVKYSKLCIIDLNYSGIREKKLKQVGSTAACCISITMAFPLRIKAI